MDDIFSMLRKTDAVGRTDDEVSEGGFALDWTGEARTGWEDDSDDAYRYEWRPVVWRRGWEYVPGYTIDDCVESSMMFHAVSTASREAAILRAQIAATTSNVPLSVLEL